MRTTPKLSLTALIAVIAMSACSPRLEQSGAIPSGAHAPGADAPIQTPAIHDWELAYSAKCASIPQEDCIGAFGFTLNGQNFRVGPGPRGEQFEGRILDAELKIIEAVLKAPLERATALAAVSETCVSRTDRGRDPSITLSRGGESSEILSVTGGKLCLRLLREDEGAALEEAIFRVIEKYYPAQFPNACIRAAQALEKTQRSVQICSADSDCAYLDDLFLPVDGQTPVVTDDCSFIQPLIVANGFLSTSNQRRLLIERELAKEVCGSALHRPGCENRELLNWNDAPPICAAGLCRAHPRTTTQRQ